MFRELRVGIMEPREMALPMSLDHLQNARLDLGERVARHDCY